MFLILDEWIFHDLQNDNDKDKQKESFQFLEKIKEKCDKIVLIENSKFEKKLWNFSKKASKNIELKYKFKFLKYSILYNSKKIEFLNLKNMELKNYSGILEGINSDDQYFVLSYIYLKQSGKESIIIITTDKKLKGLLEKKSISVKCRNDFIKKY